MPMDFVTASFSRHKGYPVIQSQSDCINTDGGWCLRKMFGRKKKVDSKTGDSLDDQCVVDCIVKQSSPVAKCSDIQLIYLHV